MQCECGEQIKLKNRFCPGCGKKIDLNRTMIEFLLEEDAGANIRSAASTACIAAIGNLFVSLFAIWGNSILSIVWSILLFLLAYGMLKYRNLIFAFCVFLYAVIMGFVALYDRYEYGSFYIPIIIAYVLFIWASYQGIEGAFEYTQYKKELNNDNRNDSHNQHK